MTGAMRSFFQLAPRSLLHLVTAILLTPRPAAASPAFPLTALGGLSFNDLFGRNDCDGTLCGYNNQLCCGVGSTCYTDTNTQAQCGVATAVASGYWQYYTTTYVETDLATVTSVMSTYVDGGASAATVTATSGCDDSSPSWCGTVCCASDQYCQTSTDGSKVCLAAAGGSSSAFYIYYTSTTTTLGATAGATAGAPVRPTSSNGVVVTTTQSPTVTVPFTAPVATGANVTLSSEEMSGGGGLSGGAIAGIVIGVLLALALLALLCFCCCVKGLLDGLLAIFGIGGRRRKRVEVEEYERRSHRTSGGGGGRTWYGAAVPARGSRQEERGEKSHEGRNLLGIGAVLAGLWAVLGLKRRRQERKNEEKYSEYSYASDYYTSASSASSDDRRTNDRRDDRRSQSRR